MAEAEWRRALREFRALLRTEKYPEGARIPAIKAIQEETGVGPDVARRVLRALDEQGELAAQVGHYGSLVLPPPRPDEIDTLLAELDTAAARLATAASEVQESAGRVWQAHQAKRARDLAEHRVRYLTDANGHPRADQV